VSDRHPACRPLRISPISFDPGTRRVSNACSGEPGESSEQRSQRISGKSQLNLRTPDPRMDEGRAPRGPLHPGPLRRASATPVMHPWIENT
jgi:hypothetical protein